MTIRCAVIFASLCLFVAVAFGQEEDSPHGEWTIQTSCSDCHTSEAWKPLKRPLTFDHDRETEFPLEQAHAVISCASCHADLQFSDETRRADIGCESCHEDVHAGSLPRTCTDCHSQTTFAGVDALAMHASTNFPLLGAHQATTCESCHVDDLGGAYAPLDVACVHCHESEYLETSLIPHIESGFGTECDDCHTEAVWPDAIFDDHAGFADGFELVGAHAFAGCESCHRTPGFQLVFDPGDQNDCIACHRDDYEDEHRGDGFPETCLDCHSQDTWDDAEFDHDDRFFPIYSGEHDGAWDGCINCHQAVPDYTLFSCLDCHEHRQSEMDDEHSGIGGYVYESLACLSCHPTGSEDDDD